MDSSASYASISARSEPCFYLFEALEVEPAHAALRASVRLSKTASTHHELVQALQLQGRLDEASRLSVSP